MVQCWWRTLSCLWQECPLWRGGLWSWMFWASWTHLRKKTAQLRDAIALTPAAASSRACLLEGCLQSSPSMWCSGWYRLTHTHPLIYRVYTITQLMLIWKQFSKCHIGILLLGPLSVKMFKNYLMLIYQNSCHLILLSIQLTVNNSINQSSRPLVRNIFTFSTGNVSIFWTANHIFLVYRCTLEGIDNKFSENIQSCQHPVEILWRALIQTTGGDMVTWSHDCFCKNIVPKGRLVSSTSRCSWW